MTDKAVSDLLAATSLNDADLLLISQSGVSKKLTASALKIYAGGGTVTSISGTGTVSGLTLSGTVTTTGNLTLSGTLDLSSPPAIGGSTPAAGTFTSLTANGNTILGDASADTVTLNAATVTLVNSTAISAASTKTLTLNGGAGSNGLVLDASNNASFSGAVTITGKCQVNSATASDSITNTFYIQNAAGTKAANLQLGSSGVLQTWVYGGSSWVNATTLDSSGNLGLGVTPSAWNGPTLQFGANAFIGSTNSTYLFANTYYNGSFRYITSGILASYYQQTSGRHAWYTAPSGTAGNAISFTQAMTLDASGNLGIGTPSPGARLDVYGSGNVSINSKGNLFVSPGGTAAQSSGAGGQISFGAWLGGDLGAPYAMAAIKGVSESSTTNTNTGALIFATAPQSTVLTERARIDSSGNLLVGTTSASETANAGVKLLPTGNAYIVNAASTGASEGFSMYSTGAGAWRFYCTWAGQIYATSTTITGISDQRLKENIRDLDDGLSTILALKPRKFDWKEGKGKDIKDDRGFIAQEFEQVFPDLVDTWKDEPPEGEEPYKAVRPDLIPVLVKAIQELSAELNELKKRIN